MSASKGRLTESIPVYVFDVDGTLADIGHRLHHIRGERDDWEAFYDACPGDKPYKHICRLAQHLISAGQILVFMSGRTECVRYQTVNWLYQYVTKPKLGAAMRLYMRPMLYKGEPDHREDHVVKRELLRQVVWDGFDPIMSFDDRDSVVKMWREIGIPCAQVREGDF